MTTPRCLGRRRPVAHGPRLSLSRYLGTYPPPPDIVDYAPKASFALGQMYLNDQLGDCVIAGMAHLVGTFTGNADGNAVVFTNDQITALYGAIGGYVPGNPSTDQGCDERTALNYWFQHGAPAGVHQIAGYLAIDPTNAAEVRTALWLFENLFFGIELPDAWVNVDASGFTWDAAPPNPANGHCVVGVGYDAAGVKVSTWGMTGTLTWAALANNVGMAASGGELYVVVSQDALSRATQKAPNGLDWVALVKDFNALGGSVPLPSPVPGPVPIPPHPLPPAPPVVPPTPAPAPSPAAPTKADIEKAVLAAIDGLPWAK